jgi:hypothetical protein
MTSKVVLVPTPSVKNYRLDRGIRRFNQAIRLCGRNDADLSTHQSATNPNKDREKQTIHFYYHPTAIETGFFPAN